MPLPAKEACQRPHARMLMNDARWRACFAFGRQANPPRRTGIQSAADSDADADSEGGFRRRRPKADSEDRSRFRRRIPTPRTDAEDRRRIPTPKAEGGFRRRRPKADSEGGFRRLVADTDWGRCQDIVDRSDSEALEDCRTIIEALHVGVWLRDIDPWCRDAARS